MNKIINNHINQEDLPSKEQLIRSTKRAFFIALAILFCFVYPAEYGIDPLFVGRLLGLTEMGKIKVSLQKDIDAKKEKMIASKESSMDSQLESDTVSEKDIIIDDNINTGTANDNTNTVIPPESTSGTNTTAPAVVNNQQEKTDTMIVVIQPDEGLEIKAAMVQGQSIKYERNVDVGHLNFDSHGESEDGQVAYYGEGRQETSGNGKIDAGFEGNHGWFFRNRSGGPVTLTLKVTGNYKELKQL